MISTGVAKYLLPLLLLVTPSVYADDSVAEVYAFFDEVTGLGIELPKAWERRDPGDTKRAMLEANERFWRRPASGGLDKSDVIFLALASPYQGSDKTRSFLSCVGSPIPPAMKDIQPSYVKGLLENHIQSTFGVYERDVTISDASRIDISGKEAYRLSVLKRNNASGSSLFVGLLAKGRLIICSGGYDSTFKSAVERSLKSIRFE